MLINRKALRDFILKKWAAEVCGWKITRVSNETYEIYEAALKNMITQDIHNHPSVGKTFSPRGLR